MNNKKLSNISLFVFYGIVLATIIFFSIYLINNRVKEENIKMIIDSNYQIILSNANDKYYYEIKDESIVSVNENGVITAKKDGKTTVVVKNSKGKEVQKIDIDVEKNPNKLDDNTNTDENNNTDTTNDNSIKPDNKPDTNTNTNNDNSNKKDSKPNTNDKVDNKTDKNNNSTNNTDNKSSTDKKEDNSQNTTNIKVVEVESVILDKTKLELTEGDKYNLKATITPSNASNKELTYTTSNNSIVSVSSSGEITAIKEGSANITVTSKNGKKGICNVTVNKKIILKDISLSDSDIYLEKNQTYKLRITFNPTDIENKNVRYSVRKESGGAKFKIDDNGLITALDYGDGLLAVYPQANSDIRKTLNVHVVHGFLNNCTNNKTIQEFDYKSPATGKNRSVKVYQCLSNFPFGIQNFAISNNYYYTLAPKHTICKEGSNISIEGQSGTCMEFKNGKNSNEYLTTYYVGGETITKYDRKTGRIISTKYLPLAGHQSFDVTADDQIYINYFALSFKYFSGYSKIKAKNSGAAYISKIENGVDGKTIYPTTAIKVSDKGVISKFTSKYTQGSSNYNKQIMDIARTSSMMENNQLAVDEKSNKVAIIDQNATSNGNKIVYIYKLSDFKKGVNTLISKFYLGKVCGTKDTPITCAIQGIELYGNYFYTVQDFERNGQRYMNITRIKYSTCPKTDSKTKCSFVENISLNKLKYGKDVPEVEGISVVNNRVYVMYFKMTDNAYKTNMLLVNGF